MAKSSVTFLSFALVCAFWGAACDDGQVGGNGDNGNGNGSELCGNGEIDGNEECDPQISSGDGVCPTSCDEDIDACTTVRLRGSAANCDARCEPESNGCAHDDDCCLDACNNNNDNNCQVECGNGVTEEGELCDGSNCPTSTTCQSSNCITRTLSGSGCEIECVEDAVAIDACNPAGPDQCCPRDCTGSTDADCTGAFGDIGHACNDDSDCQSGLCGTADGYGNPGGYCTMNCYDTPYGCGSGNHCGVARDGLRFCVDNCDSDDDCRPGYECFDGDGDQVDECQAVGATSGGKAIGEVCDTTAECAGGQSALCAAAESSSAPAGYCTQRLCTGAPLECPTGSHCAVIQGGYGFCLDNCGGDCTSRHHYACYDADGDGDDECWIAPAGGGAIGDACEGPTNCGGGAHHFCFRFWTGGYCAANCTPGEGLDNCPLDSHCVNFGEYYTCLETCTDTCDRGTPYECRNIDEDQLNECVEPS